MSARQARVAIVGGGLSGLLAAWLLQRQGMRDLLLFEARESLGGRILSVDAAGNAVDASAPALDRFDLGPTWFWPDMQPQLDQLVGELGLQRFEQFEAGEMLLERSPHQAPQRVPGYASAPASMRLAGGSGALIAAIHRELDPSRVLRGQAVRRLHRVGPHIELHSESAAGEIGQCRVDHVLLALPPRLAAQRIAFDPPLPPELTRRWQATPTWMAPHAKYVAIYEQPFWREQGLSGAARSACGPMVEIHDVSMPGGHAALFGFVGVPARVRRQVSSDELRAHCRVQLRRLFGEPAAAPVGEALKDWAADPLTATDADQEAGAHHAEAPTSALDTGPWQAVLTGIASEWSPLFPGYLAGAADAAARGVQHWRAMADGFAKA